MLTLQTEFLVIGSGFAGSLTALCLHRLGRDVVVVDRGTHPRFAIGESTTPLADMQLLRIAETYRLPRLFPLTAYGSWKQAYPQVACGLKRGFSYFRHQPGREFQTDAVHANQLIVAASPRDEVGDTHWLRSDVDAFFLQEVVAAGIPVLEGTEPRLRSRSPWVWTGLRDGEATSEIQAEFVVDASGPGGAVPRSLGTASLGSEFVTRSRALYGHVAGLRPWHDLLQEMGISTSDHPFRCDRAAVHHLIDEGWHWQLPFDNGVTSVGFVLEDDAEESAPAREWDRLLARYPSLSHQFREARTVAPAGGWQSSRRLQRGWARLADRDYILLPATAGFIDPLHSSGIAHALFGIRSFVDMVAADWGRPTFLDGLQRYEARTLAELRAIDLLVAACYATRDRMDLFEAATALYFTAAIHAEERLQSGESPPFLSLDVDDLRDGLERTARLLIDSRGQKGNEQSLIREVRQAIAPWNVAGLLDPSALGMYRNTSANKPVSPVGSP